MSFSCDVNVLLYGSDSSSPVHPPARAFLKQAAGGGDLFCLGWPTVMSYLRIATHPGIFSAPLTPAEALRNVDALVSLPHVRRLAEENGFLEVRDPFAAQLRVRRRGPPRSGPPPSPAARA